MPGRSSVIDAAGLHWYCRVLMNGSGGVSLNPSPSKTFGSFPFAVSIRFGGRRLLENSRVKGCDNPK